MLASQTRLRAAAAARARRAPIGRRRPYSLRPMFNHIIEMNQQRKQIAPPTSRVESVSSRPRPSHFGLLRRMFQLMQGRCAGRRCDKAAFQCLCLRSGKKGLCRSRQWRSINRHTPVTSGRPFEPAPLYSLERHGRFPSWLFRSSLALSSLSCACPRMPSALRQDGVRSDRLT